MCTHTHTHTQLTNSFSGEGARGTGPPIQLSATEPPDSYQVLRVGMEALYLSTNCIHIIHLYTLVECAGHRPVEDLKPHNFITRHSSLRGGGGGERCVCTYMYIIIIVSLFIRCTRRCKIWAQPLTCIYSVWCLVVSLPRPSPSIILS